MFGAFGVVESGRCRNRALAVARGAVDLAELASRAGLVVVDCGGSRGGRVALAVAE
jgi:hypothetical protein